LQLALVRCRALGLDQVLVTCDVTNEASRRIIEANGGVLEDVLQVEGRDVATMGFWIDLSLASG
jgi:predicted acetyltransferase